MKFKFFALCLFIAFLSLYNSVIAEEENPIEPVYSYEIDALNIDENTKIPIESTQYLYHVYVNEDKRINWYSSEVTNSETQQNFAKYVHFKFDILSSDAISYFRVMPCQYTYGTSSNFGTGSQELDILVNLESRQIKIYRNGHPYYLKNGSYWRNLDLPEAYDDYFGQIRLDVLYDKDKSQDIRVKTTKINVRIWNVSEEELDNLIYKERVLDDDDDLYDSVALKDLRKDGQQYIANEWRTSYFYRGSTYKDALGNVVDYYNQITDTMTFPFNANANKTFSNMKIPYWQWGPNAKYKTIHYSSIIKTSKEMLEKSNGRFVLNLSDDNANNIEIELDEIESDREYKIDIVIDVINNKTYAYVDGILVK